MITKFLRSLQWFRQDDEDMHFKDEKFMFNQSLCSHIWNICFGNSHIWNIRFGNSCLQKSF